jgi:hypothetical protein
MSIELNKCSCGGNAAVEMFMQDVCYGSEHDSIEFYFVRCDSCDYQTNASKKWQDAFNDWNNRNKKTEGMP